MSTNTSKRPQRWLPLGGGIVVAATMLSIGSGVSAQPPYVPDDPKTTVAQPLPDCKNADGSWAVQPRVVVHTLEYLGTTPSQDAVDALRDVGEQIGATGGHGAEVTSTTEWPLTEFHHKTAYGDIVPTIHVGFVDDLPEPAGVTGTVLAESVRSITDGPCEAHIAIVETGTSWNYGTPLRHGPAGPGEHLYYQAGRADPNGTDYLRVSYLHELLHAFGLEHTAAGFAFENYGERPWRRSGVRKMIRPLPDDVEHLRDLYPSTETFTDVSLLNTWYDPADVSSTGAARQSLLCAPSAGDRADRWDDPNKGDGLATCGTSGGAEGSTSVCSGATVQTRVAFANLSSDAVEVTVRYWLSTDDTWSSSDHLSATEPASIDVTRTGSALLSDTWVVPDLGRSFSGLSSAAVGSRQSTPIAGEQGSPSMSTDYFVIARVEATTDAGTTTRDWIPLRGQLSHNDIMCGS